MAVLLLPHDLGLVWCFAACRTGAANKRASRKAGGARAWALNYGGTGWGFDQLISGSRLTPAPLAVPGEGSLEAVRRLGST